jgi:hypothetical protein
MASEQRGGTHLAQTQIPDIVSIMEDLESWLASRHFNFSPGGDIGRCSDSKAVQRNKLDPLFRALGISSEVKSPFRCITYADVLVD